MAGTIQSLFKVMLEASFFATTLAIIIAMVQYAMRRRLGPAWRFALWTPVLLRLLIPVLPESAISVYNVPAWYMAWRRETPDASPLIQPDATILPAAEGSLGEIEFEHPPALQPPGRTTTPLSLPSSRFSLWSFAATGWACGVVIFLSRLASGTCWISLRVQRQGRNASAELYEILRAAGGGHPPRLRLIELPLAKSPALFGLWRPVLLLPTQFSQRLTPSEIHHVFLHELAHLKRRDLLLNFLMALAQCVHWFNPAVWLVFRQMRLERELACDEMALRERGVSNPKSYGETILRLLEGVDSRSVTGALVGIAEEKYSAKQRLRQIATFHGTKRKYWLGAALLAVIGLIGLTNAQAPKRSDAAREPAKQPVAAIPMEVTPRPKSLEEKLYSTRVDTVDLEALTLTEALQTLRRKCPAILGDARFLWFQTTNLSGGTDAAGHSFSANAIGYIQTEIGKISTPADDIDISQQYLSPTNTIAKLTKLRDIRLSAILDLLVEGAAKRIQYTFGDNEIVFSFPAKGPLAKGVVVQPTLLLAADARQTDRVFANSRRQEIIQKLSEAIISNYEVKEVPLSEIIKDLDATLRARDQGKNRVNFLLSREIASTDTATPSTLCPISDFRVTIEPALRNIRLLDLLNAVMRVAVPREGTDPNTRLRYSIEDYAVVIGYLRPESEPLYTRTYKVDSNTFLQGLNDVYAGFDPATPNERSLQDKVRHFFSAAGINFPASITNPQRLNPSELPPQKAIFFNDRSGVLFVRATLRDLDAVEKALQALNVGAPLLTIRAEQVKLKNEGELDLLVRELEKIQGKFRPALTSLEYEKFKRATEKGERFFVRINPAPVTTLSGRSARLSLDEHAVDVRCDYSERNNSFHIEARSFETGHPEKSHTRRGSVYDGQTFVLLPSFKNHPSPAYITFITTELVDAAGNRIYTPDAEAIRDERTPPQKGEY